METLKEIILMILLVILLSLLLSNRAEASLFEDNYDFTTENEGDSYIVPSYSDIPEDLNLIPEDEQKDENTLSVSGGDYVDDSSALFDVSVLSDEIVELYTINQNVANQYLSSAIVTVFDKAISGASYGSDYVAWRDDVSDSNSGYLIIGKGKVNGSNITFESGAILCHYYRTWISSTNYQYNYSVVHTDDAYSINFSNRLIYTNLIEGYPVLGDRIDTKSDKTFFLIAVGIILIIFIVLKRR